MQYHLVVVRAFGLYAKGDIITDPETIAAVIGGETVNNVVRIVAQEG